MNAANPPSAPISTTKPEDMTPTEAFAAARRSWTSSLLICGVGLVVIMGILVRRGQPSAEQAAAEASGVTLGSVLVAAAVLWLALVGPIVFLLRSYCFAGSWSGRTVEPGSYLKGMGSIWGVLTIGAMFALIGAAIDGQVMPGGLVALVATMLLALVGPDRKSLGVKR